MSHAMSQSKYSVIDFSKHARFYRNNFPRCFENESFFREIDAFHARWRVVTRVSFVNRISREASLAQLPLHSDRLRCTLSRARRVFRAVYQIFRDLANAHFFVGS